MTNISTEEFLAHYGVLGMKWGKRKSPDQVAKDRKAAYAEKADKIQAKADMMSTKIKELTAIKTDSNFRNKLIQNDIADLRKERARLVADAERKRNGKLTKTQKNLLIGAAVVGGIVLAKTGRYNLESGAFRKLATKGAAFIKNKAVIDTLKRSDDLARVSMSADDILETVVKKANPGFGGIGTKLNCRRATMAFEMRRRGYDVVATRTTNSNGQNAVGLLSTLSPGKKALPTSSYGGTQAILKEQKNALKPRAQTPIFDLTMNFNAGARKGIELPSNGTNKVQGIFDALVKQPNGSRGELGVAWSMGGGHSMAYEIVNNKPIIFDAQTGKKFESASEFVKSMTADMPKGAVVDKNNLIGQAGFTRLDDIELNTDYLLRWIRNA